LSHRFTFVAASKWADDDDGIVVDVVKRFP
jgi:hypothetical protein